MKRKVKGIISLVLMLTMSLTMLTPAYAANLTQAETQASALKQLRLFKGASATDFDLDRAPTRIEAMVMLIRVLGKEGEALNGSFTHPFTDVASWADKYVGYAYQNGLTNGVSANEFGAGNASSAMYLTFVLRALGYDDGAGDFAWNEPDVFAKSAGILPDGVDTANFLRADVALVSWAALEAKLKDKSQTLSEKLMNAGAFTLENYSAAKQFEAGDGGASVSTFAQLQAAVENKGTAVVTVNSDISIASTLTFERNNDLMIYIKEGVTLTVSDEFIPVFCSMINDGAIIINGTFDRGACNFINNGSVTVKSGGIASSGMCNTYNYGAFNVDVGGNLLIERGTQFHNFGTVTNNGYISIKDGGSVFNETGSIINNGTIDLDSYFSGDIADITGTGTIKDNRK